MFTVIEESVAGPKTLPKLLALYVAAQAVLVAMLASGGFDFALSLDSVKSAIVVSLLSVWVLIGLFTYLNRYTKRRYFTLWTVAWLFYALWLSLNYGQTKFTSPWLEMCKQWCIGVSATFLLWGSFRFLALRVRQLLLGLFIGFLLAWSYVGAFYIRDALEFQLPIFILIGAASLLASICFFRYRRRKGFIGATLLGMGFFLWGGYFATYPLLQRTEAFSASAFFISAVLQLFIAVSMIILVLEEVRHANQSAIQQIRSHKTEKRALRTQVLCTEERYRSLFEQANEAIIITSADDLRIIEMNPAGQKILGISQHEPVVHYLPAFCQPLHENCLAPSVGDQWFYWARRQPQLKLIRKNGGSTVVEAEGALIQFDGKAAYQFFFREVTDRHKLEQQLRQAEKLSALGQMISGVAHELNNPLAVIKGYLELITAHHDLPPQTKADLEKVAHESARAAKLVRNFLAFAREQASDREMVNLNDLIERIATLRKFDLQKNDTDLSLDLTDALPQTYADPDQLQQILVNLVTNASQALQSRPKPRRIRISTYTKNERIFAVVEDNGPGVPAHLEQKIFEPFFTTKEVGVGTGLGLSIAHSIMTEHNGKIFYQTSSLGGAAFTLELPLTSAPEVQPRNIVKDATPIRIEPARRKSARAQILVLDDELSLAELLCEMLTMLGHDAAFCLNPALALQMIETRSYDLILSDFRMPVMNGQEFYRRAVEKCPELADRVVFLTGDVVTEDTHSFLVNNGNPHLAKPFQLADLERVVGEMLAKRDKSAEIKIAQ